VSTEACVFRMANLWNAFAACADADPSAPAIVFGESTTSFAELHALALRYAAALAARGIGRGDVVALQLPKRQVTYGLLLACLRLGAPYVFLDPKNPLERSLRIIERVQPAIFFTAGATPNPHGQTVQVSGDGDAWLDRSAANLPSNCPDVTGTDPAYIMFTSGSTGEPKGAVIPHQGVLSLMAWARAGIHTAPGERFTNINPLHFDNSVFDIYCGLLNGVALVPIETGEITNPATWVKTVRAAAAKVMFAVPTLFLVLDQLGLLTPAALPCVHTFIFGGEGYPIGKLRDFHARFAGQARLINVYGPTETSCICSSIEILPEHLAVPDTEFPPLGRMHHNFSYAILDGEQRSVAPGDVGELWIGGPCVGLGYYANDDETASRFRQDPRQDRYRSIYYRSGDLVREDEGRRLWFQGRADNQVKLRGYRIELEEVDLAVQSIADVRRAVAVVLAGTDGGELAVAFMADRTIAADEVHALCKQKLPGYMQPSVIIQLSDLPRNANGKVDRRATKALLERAAST
jgi:D-alanine--poly(phosphoribitol) ligase subunit 1